ncbi:hypothetical protein PILCRDRAFT_93882 [Piloderma croceum F 1598]|uniref:Uncharacterized protein n=1 Tax=Piloderma croceum (strain F 1598) TaxID=765440 RepID=A0A0C3ETH5_PILCF|nr:hypothetical protein PILCRDRAFT_93882 [Piloderma croceum F 1598]
MSQPSSPAPSRSSSVASDREIEPTHSIRRGQQHRERLQSIDEPDQSQRHGIKDLRGRSIDQVEDTGRAVTKTATSGQVAGNNDENGAISLRLDLNLDVYVKLKAKVHGDITLQLL